MMFLLSTCSPLEEAELLTWSILEVHQKSLPGSTAAQAFELAMAAVYAEKRCEKSGSSGAQLQLLFHITLGPLGTLEPGGPLGTPDRDPGPLSPWAPMGPLGTLDPWAPGPQGTPDRRHHGPRGTLGP